MSDYGIDVSVKTVSIENKCLVMEIKEVHTVALRKLASLHFLRC